MAVGIKEINPQSCICNLATEIKYKLFVLELLANLKYYPMRGVLIILYLRT